ncbi:MAG: hypothetical protein KGJ60_01150 [Verrucomicrobiota bacterium]|nr:hypothetical protein [Verrucomicrobiota bacterium]
MILKKAQLKLPARIPRGRTGGTGGFFLVLAAAWWAAFPTAAQTTNATDFAAFQIIRQRNIFNQNRRPHLAARAPRVVDSFSLVGTMSYAKGNFAFFNGSSPEFRKVLQAGGEIAGFKVAAIAPDCATLLDGTNRLVLKVSAQLRRDDSGQWVLSTEPAAYSETPGPAQSGGGTVRRSNRAGGRNIPTAAVAGGNLAAPPEGLENGEMDGLAPPPEATEDAEMATNTPETSGAPNDVLERLMRLRQQQEKQSGP